MSSHPVAAAFAPRLTACLPPPPTHSQAPPAPGRCPRQSSSLRASSKSGTLHSLITSSAAIHSSSTPLQRNSQASAVVLLLLPRGLSVSATTWGGYARQAALAVHVASHVLSLVMCLDGIKRQDFFGRLYPDLRRAQDARGEGLMCDCCVLPVSPLDWTCVSPVAQNLEAAGREGRSPRKTGQAAMPSQKGGGT